MQYFSQKKAQMTGNILDQVLSKINMTLQVSGHSFLLLMDNTGCHPQELQRKYTNVMIVFCQQMPCVSSAAAGFGNHPKL